MVKPRKDHEHPADVSALLAEIADRGKKYVLAEARYSPEPSETVRYLLYRLHADPSRLEYLTALWLQPGEVKKVGRTECIFGDCDAMYATASDFVWFRREGKFQLFRRRGQRPVLFFEADETFFRIHCHPLRGREFPLSAVSEIHVFLEHGWSVSGVRLLSGERRFTLARKTEWSAAADPTYDWINLLADTSWAVDLATALATFTGKKIIKAADLE